MYLGGRPIAKGFKRMSFSTVASFTNNLPVRMDERELLQCVVAVCCCSVLLQCVVAVCCCMRCSTVASFTNNLPVKINKQYEF